MCVLSTSTNHVSSSSTQEAGVGFADHVCERIPFPENVAQKMHARMAFYLLLHLLLLLRSAACDHDDDDDDDPRCRQPRMARSPPPNVNSIMCMHVARTFFKTSKCFVHPFIPGEVEY